MKIETETRDNHQVKLTVEVEPDLFEEAKRKAARKLSRRVKIPGFRPGKAPYQVVLRQFGESAIIEDAIELLVEDVYPRAIEEAEIKPYGPGTLENIASTEPPVLEFLIPLDAEVKLGDYKSIQKPYEPEEVTDQAIENVIKDLRERQAIHEPVERPAEMGDLVAVKITGERTEVETGVDPFLVKDHERQVLIQPESEDDDHEWPYPGFSRVLIGMNVDDEKTTEHTFSEDTDFEDLRGVKVVFTFKASEIKKRILPEVDDEFASTIGEFENLEALREAIRESLEMQAKDIYNENYDDEILNEAIEQTEFKYPPQMLEDEIDQVIHNLEHRLNQQNLDLDLYLKTRQISMEDLREEAKTSAEGRLKRSLVLYELAQAENIEVETQEVQTETIRALDFLSRSLSKKETQKLTRENSVRNVMQNVMADLLARKAMERLRAIASGINPEDEITSEQSEETQEPTAEEAPEAESRPADVAPAPGMQVPDSEDVEASETVESEVEAPEASASSEVELKE